MALAGARTGDPVCRAGPPEAVLDDILDLALGFQHSRVFLTACELDLFSAIGDEELAAAEIAARVAVDAGAMARLLNALCSLGLVRRGSGGFANSLAARRYLVTGAPDRVSLLFHAQRWDNWNLLTDAIRSGHCTVVKPAHDPPAVWLRAFWVRARRFLARLWAVVSGSDAWLRAFVDYLRDHARIVAPHALPLLDLSGVRRVLDVGGAHAVYAAAFAEVHDDVQVTVFDLPEIVPFTRENIEKRGLSDRITTVAGNFHRDELGTGYDLVFVSETVHANTDPENVALVQKAYRALNLGGQLVVQDYVLDDDRSGPLFATMLSLDMLMTKEGGDMYSESEIRDWMEAAGFQHIERRDTRAATTLIIGRKGAGDGVSRRQDVRARGAGPAHGSGSGAGQSRSTGRLRGGAAR